MFVDTINIPERMETNEKVAKVMEHIEIVVVEKSFRPTGLRTLIPIGSFNRSASWVDG